MSAVAAEPTQKLNKGRLAAYAVGNFGQSLFYNALSTYFVVYATTSLFASIDMAGDGEPEYGKEIAKAVLLGRED